MEPKLKTMRLLYKGQKMQKRLIHFKHYLIISLQNLNLHWNKTWYKYLIIFFAGLIIYTKDIYFVLQLQNNKSNYSYYEQSTKGESDSTRVRLQSFSGIKNKKEFQVVPIKNESPKEKRYKNYINNYHKLAIEEMHRYKIPASITLAQGLLETNGGKSKLATENLNHFGIKCFSKKCKKGHCSNFNDDSHKDFFRKYNSVKESYRARSIFLKKDRYKKLFNFKINDYKSWAKGLKECGYATDKKYAEKLIALIQKYNLNQFDEM